MINSAKLDSKGSKYFYKARVIDSSNGVSSIYYSCSSPDNSSLDSIYGMSQTQINSAMRVHNPDINNLVNDNGEGPHSIYEKIRSILLSVSCSYKFVKLGDDAKQKKWKQDLSIFPEYAYLSWNESLEGITKAASIILSNSIEHEVKRAEKISGILRSKAQVKINEKLKALGIQNKVPSIQGISASVNFELKNQLTDLFVRKDNSENDVHIDNQGEGIKRQIWFALLRLQAEQVESEVNNKRYVWCFDEPETHLHPKAQREFIATLRALAMQNFQILVSTHSTVFVNASKLDEINTFSISQNYTSIGSSQTVEDIFETLGVLNSDFLFYNKFLVVEGQTEEALIPFLYNLYKNRTLREDNVQLINLKGCNNEALASSLLDNLIKGFSKLEDLAVYLFDADTGRSTNGSTFVIGKQDLEDSFPPHIWPNMVSQVYGETISVTEEEVINLIASIPDVVAGTNLPIRANLSVN